MKSNLDLFLQKMALFTDNHSAHSHNCNEYVIFLLQQDDPFMLSDYLHNLTVDNTTK